MAWRCSEFLGCIQLFRATSDTQWHWAGIVWNIFETWENPWSSQRLAQERSECSEKGLSLILHREVLCFSRTLCVCQSKKEATAGTKFFSFCVSREWLESYLAQPELLTRPEAIAVDSCHELERIEMHVACFTYYILWPSVCCSYYGWTFSMAPSCESRGPAIMAFVSTQNSNSGMMHQRTDEIW